MSAAQSAIGIRDIQTIPELFQVEQLQKEVWGVEDREIFPALAMIPMRHVGGVLLGAFDGGKLVGFSFAFPGFEEGHPILHSDMLAVLPAYRSLGLGLQLKLAQRKHALEQGVETITWTFDPLQSLNANLNFAKLGVVSDRYFVNYYGETTSFLHSTGTDRLWVKWKLNSKWVKDRVARHSRNEEFQQSLPSMLTVDEEGSFLVTLNCEDARVFLDVPGDYNKLINENRNLALSWREATREGFTTALANGYVVRDFCLVKSEERTFGRYLLSAKDARY
jgi:predicted GNAT superfamily acetyltransferase